MPLAPLPMLMVWGWPMVMVLGDGVDAALPALMEIDTLGGVMEAEGPEWMLAPLPPTLALACASTRPAAASVSSGLRGAGGAMGVSWAQWGGRGPR
jgi:hypothetical protein